MWAGGSAPNGRPQRLQKVLVEERAGVPQDRQAVRVVTRPGLKEPFDPTRHRFRVTGPDFTLTLAPTRQAFLRAPGWRMTRLAQYAQGARVADER